MTTWLSVVSTDEWVLKSAEYPHQRGLGRLAGRSRLAVLPGVPTLLGEQFHGVALVQTQPLARVPRFHRCQLCSVPDLHKDVLCAVARAQRCLLGESRIRSLLPLATVPTCQLRVVAAVPGVELLARRQMPLRHLCMVVGVPAFNVGVLRGVPLSGDVS
jgi:hypothetical protein